MSKNQTITLIIAIIVIVGGVMWWSSSRSEAATGSMVVGVTDATSQINNVNKISMTVDKVEVHSQTQGWTTVSSDSKTYDLLALHSQGKLAYYAKVDVPADNYDQVRITLGDVKINDNTSAVLPSHTILMNDNVAVNANQTASLKLDFLADQSLHTTANGSYVFAPVVNYESNSNAQVNVNGDDSVAITNGDNSNSTSGSVGMDVNGDTKAGFTLGTTAQLNVDAASGIISLSTAGNDTMNSSSTSSANSSSSNSNVNINGAVSGSVGGNGTNTSKNILPIKSTTSGSGSSNSNTSVSGMIQ